MAINKYGNDFKNNIFWYKEYPFIPEVTNDFGFTVHEGDIVDFHDKYYKKIVALRVYKIYNKDLIWTKLINQERKISNFTLSANEMLPYTSKSKVPPLEDFDNQNIFNPLRIFLSQVYARIYPDELNLPNDWHFDEEKYEAKRLEEVAKLKNKY